MKAKTETQQIANTLKDEFEKVFKPSPFNPNNVAHAMALEAGKMHNFILDEGLQIAGKSRGAEAYIAISNVYLISLEQYNLLSSEDVSNIQNVMEAMHTGYEAKERFTEHHKKLATSNNPVAIMIGNVAKGSAEHLSLFVKSNQGGGIIASQAGAIGLADVVGAVSGARLIAVWSAANPWAVVGGGLAIGAVCSLALALKD